MTQSHQDFVARVGSVNRQGPAKLAIWPEGEFVHVNVDTRERRASPKSRMDYSQAIVGVVERPAETWLPQRDTSSI